MNAPDVAAVACRTLLGEQITQARILSDTPGSSVVRTHLVGGGSVIVRLHAGALRRRAREQQGAMAAVAAYTRVRTPRVLACGALPGGAVSALITTDLGPVDLGRAVREGMCTRDQALEILGGLLALLHQLPLLCGPRPRAGRGARIDAPALIERCPAPLADTVAPVLDRAATKALAAARPVWCHGDLHPANVLLPQAAPGDLGPAYVIDFEQMLCAAREYDLAQCLVTSDALAPRERALVTAGYSAPVDEKLLDELIVFHAVRGLVYAGHVEGRDTSLWSARADYALEHCLERPV